MGEACLAVFARQMQGSLEMAWVKIREREVESMSWNQMGSELAVGMLGNQMEISELAVGMLENQMEISELAVRMSKDSLEECCKLRNMSQFLAR